jgi:hypothetical protein
VLPDNLPAEAGYHTLASADIFGLSESVLVTGTASPTNLTGRSHIAAGLFPHRVIERRQMIVVQPMTQAVEHLGQLVQIGWFNEERVGS